MTFKNLNLAVGVSFAARINKINFVYPSCKRYCTTKTTDTQSKSLCRKNRESSRNDEFVYEYVFEA